MRILVCGGREYDDWLTLSNFLYREFHPAGFYDGNEPDPILIQGGAKGADFLARVWAVKHGFSYEEYPANWKEYGPAAGIRRNQQMLDEGKPDLVVAFPGGNGTADMVRRAKKAGVEVIEVEDRSS